MRPLPRAAAVAALIAGAWGCGDPAPDETPPVLSQPMIDLAHVIEFLPFGAALPGSGVLNPAYELRTDDDTLGVVAVSPGVVVAIRANADDSEIEIRPSQGSTYAVIYDHVRELDVAVGASVQPGTVLGRIGAWSPSPRGRTELQINRDGSPTLALCPVQFGTAQFNIAHFDAMAATTTAPSLCVLDSVVP